MRARDVANRKATRVQRWALTRLTIVAKLNNESEIAEAQPSEGFAVPMLVEWQHLRWTIHAFASG